MNIDGNALRAYGDGAVIAIVSIVMVFAVLLLIIVLTEIISKIAGKEETKEVVASAGSTNTIAPSSLNINDEDATIACLIASIDLRNETNKQVQVLSVREVK